MEIKVQCPGCNQTYRVPGNSTGKKAKCTKCAAEIVIGNAAAPPWHCFVSYSQPDKAVAEAVVAKLEQHDLRCWIAPRDVPAGTNWAGAILEAIGKCPLMILIYSKHSDQSKQVIREVERAVAKGSVVLPFRIDDCRMSPEMEYFLSATHWLDASRGDRSGHLAQLVNESRASLKLERRRPPVPVPPPRRSPWTGLAAKCGFAALGLLLIVSAAGLASRFFLAPRPATTPEPQAVSIVQNEFTQMADDIKTHVTPFVWEPQNEIGAAISVGNGRLTISAPLATHREVVNFLQSQRQLKDPDAKLLNLESLFSASNADSQSKAKLLNALEEPTRIEFIEAPLNEVVSFLADQHAVEFTIDDLELSNAGASSDEPVTEVIKGVTLHSALARMLHKRHLDYVLRNDSIVITTAEVAERTLLTIIYDVRDLAEQEP